MSKINKHIIRTSSHVLFWVLYFVFMLVQYTFLQTEPNYRRAFTSLIITLPVDILATYFSAYFILPKLIFTKRYFHAVWVFLISAISFIFLQRLIIVYIYAPLLYPEKAGEYSLLHFNYFYSLVNIYMVAGFFVAIKLLKQWFENQNIRTELESQNKHSEIALLRNQINPHFLFNTLNNIDTLITENQEEASDSILKLSEIMRYMLYDSNTEYVPLSKELNYLKSFISLQKIRLKNPECVKFEIIGNEKNKLIAPMLLIPFVENAFKHGSLTQQSEGVSIILSAQKSYIEFVVVNDVNKSDISSKDTTQGIGLNNVKRRLDLIYKNQYNLDIDSKNNKFIVKLRINFNAN